LPGPPIRAYLCEELSKTGRSWSVDQREKAAGVRLSSSETWKTSFPGCNVINMMIAVTQTLREKTTERCVRLCGVCTHP
jgi:hypothetical protein